MGKFFFKSFFFGKFIQQFRSLERMKSEKTIHMATVKFAKEKKIHANPSNKTSEHGLCDGTSVFVTS